MMRTELRFTLSDGKKTPRNGEIVFLMIFKPWPRSISIPWHQFPAILLLATLFLAGASVNDMGGPAVPDSHLIPDYMNLTTSKHSVFSLVSTPSGFELGPLLTWRADVGAVPGPDSCDRQSLGMSCTGGVTLSKNCVGPVCPSPSLTLDYMNLTTSWI